MGENGKRTSKEDLERIWQEYKEAVRAKGFDQAKGLYREMVWPYLLARWKEEPKVHPRREEFQASIHTLGESPEATVLAILGTGTKKAYVLHTAESETHLDWIRKETGKEVYPILIDKSDVGQIYQGVHDLLKRVAQKGETPVALDITGGTKTMSAGLAAAGFFFQRFYQGLELRVVYVEGKYDKQLSRPEAGTERLILLPNPHEVVGEVNALFAKELYDKRDFSGAAGYFYKVTGPNQPKYSLYATLCKMYANWWALDFEEALESGERLLRELGKDANFSHPLTQKMDRLQKWVDLLREAAAYISNKDPGRSKGALGVAATLIWLSEEERKLVLKALYAYRALELLLQERLYKLFGWDTENPRISPEEKEKLKVELSRIFSKEEPRIKMPLGLLDRIAFLRVLGDPLLKGESLQHIQALSGAIRTRNSSLLIHGLDVPSEEGVKKVQEMAKRLYQDLEKHTRFQPDLELIRLEL